MSEKLKLLSVYLMPAFLLSLILILFHVSSPLGLGPAGILAAFGTMYLFCASILFALASLAITLVMPFRPIEKKSKRRLYYMASVIALAPILLLALHTIGQLGLKDFILVSLLVAATCFYIFHKVQ